MTRSEPIIERVAQRDLQMADGLQNAAVIDEFQRYISTAAAKSPLQWAR